MIVVIVLYSIASFKEWITQILISSLYLEPSPILFWLLTVASQNKGGRPGLFHCKWCQCLSRQKGLNDLEVFLREWGYTFPWPLTEKFRCELLFDHCRIEHTYFHSMWDDSQQCLWIGSGGIRMRFCNSASNVDCVSQSVDQRGFSTIRNLCLWKTHYVLEHVHVFYKELLLKWVVHCIVAFILGKSNLMDAISFVLGEKTLNLRVRNLKVHTYRVHVTGPLWGAKTNGS